VTRAPWTRYAWVGALCLAVGAAWVGLAPMGDWDVWWHMKTGHLALERASTLPEDPFSLLRQGQPWRYKDLGADVLLALLDRAGGQWGLAAFKLCASMGAAALALRLAARRAGPSVALLAASAAFWILSFRVTERPEAFSLLLFPALLWLLDPDEGRELGWREVGGGVVLQLMWANLHRACVLGLVFWGARAVASLGAALASSDKERRHALLREAARVGVGLAASAGASLLNPSGLGLFVQSATMSQDPILRQSVSEWAKLDLATYAAEFPLAAAWACLAVPLVGYAAWGAWRKGDPRGALWGAALLVLGLGVAQQAPRMLPWMAFALVGPWAAGLAELGARLWERGGSKLPPPQTLPVLAGTMGLALGVTLGLVEAPSPGWAARWYPEEPARMLAQGSVKGAGFPSFTSAGYVLYHAWPAQRSVCDGRLDTVFEVEDIKLCMGAEGDPAAFESLRRRFDLQWALAPNRPGPDRDPARPSGMDFLEADPAWALVWWGEPWLLYVRRQGPNEALAQTQGYRLLKPRALLASVGANLQAAQRDPARLEALDGELRRALRSAPEDYRLWIARALFLRSVGAHQDPELGALLRKLDANRARDPEVIAQALALLRGE
jgi:hypothetical protein